MEPMITDNHSPCGSHHHLNINNNPSKNGFCTHDPRGFILIKNDPLSSSIPHHPGEEDELYLERLVREQENVGFGAGMDITKKLLSQEIERVQNGGRPPRTEEKKMADVTKNKSIKVTVRVLVPVRDHPKFNFVGKLLGPRGNSLKRLQEETMTKMAILGRGSMRDRTKEDELRLSGDSKFQHLTEDLHVEVAAVAPPAEAHARIAFALTEIRRYLVPDYNDDIRQEQMREIHTMKTRPMSRGTPSLEEGDEECQKTIGPNAHARPSDSPLSDKKFANGRNSRNGIELNADKETSHPSKSSRGGVVAVGRRSVLSILTNARVFHQKEKDLFFQDMQNHHHSAIYDSMLEIPIAEQNMDDISGRSLVGPNAIKFSAILPSSDRTRYRHDPYQRIASIH